MKMLTAQRPILYMGRMYNPGGQLPAHDGEMLTAWLNAGSATWTDSDGSAPEAGQPAPDSAATPDEQPTMGVESGVETPTPATHMDAGQLVTMKKADLEKLAGDMGMDISEAKNNGERAKLLAAVPMESPKQEIGGTR